MLLKLLRYLRGYVRFEARGRFVERFLNIASHCSIRVWDPEKRGEVLCGCLYMRDYLHIRTPAKKSGVRLRIKEKKGLPVLMKRYRDRVGLAVGIPVFLLTIQIMSLFLWSVNITGLKTLSQSEVNAALKAEGVFVGAFKPSLDFPTAARNVQLRLKDVGWMAINVTGSHASVEIKEDAAAPKMKTPATPANVKAKADGQILKMNVFEGESLLKIGSGVVKDQLLVSGVMTDDLGGVRLVRARAEIFAKTKRSCRFSREKKITRWETAGETAQRSRISGFGLSLPLRFRSVKSDFAATRTTAFAPFLNDVLLPVYLEKENVLALKKATVTLSDNSAKELLLKEAALYEAFSLSACQVEHRDFSVSQDENHFYLDATFTCVEDIAKTEEIPLDDDLVLRPRPSETTEEE